MKRLFQFLLLLHAAVVPAGATAFVGPAFFYGGGFISGTGCEAFTLDQSGIILADAEDGFHISGSATFSGDLAQPADCSTGWFAARILADPAPSEVVVGLSQTASVQATGDWFISFYRMTSIVSWPCNQVSTSVRLEVPNPESGNLDIAPTAGATCDLSSGVGAPHYLNGWTEITVHGSGQGSLTINYGNSAEIFATPLNPVPEPATLLLVGSALAAAAMIRWRTGRASARPSPPSNRA